MTRTLSPRDRAFLDRHRALGREDERTERGTAELIDVAGEIRRETEKAYLFFDGAREEWVPKSQAAQVDGGLRMPEWIAKTKGFI